MHVGTQRLTPPPGDTWHLGSSLNLSVAAIDMQGTGNLEKVRSENWVKETITAWRHSIWVGIWDPWIVIWKGET